MVMIQCPVCFKMAATSEKHEALSFKILAKCSTTKARTAILTLPHHAVETPVFMPVGTQGTMKGLTCKQLEDLDCQIILGNTYHLGMRPVRLRRYLPINALYFTNVNLHFQGTEILDLSGGLHKFMNWKRALLTVCQMYHSITRFPLLLPWQDPGHWTLRRSGK